MEPFLSLGSADELALAWRDAARRLEYNPDSDNFIVSYNGPDDEWLWTAVFHRPNSDPPFAPEGWGQTPVLAVRALIEAVDHGVGYWPIKRPWDRKSREWASEEGSG
jgi:hypothetical protein